MSGLSNPRRGASRRTRTWLLHDVESRTGENPEQGGWTLTPGRYDDVSETVEVVAVEDVLRLFGGDGAIASGRHCGKYPGEVIKRAVSRALKL